MTLNDKLLMLELELAIEKEKVAGLINQRITWMELYAEATNQDKSKLIASFPNFPLETEKEILRMKRLIEGLPNDND